MEYRVVKSTDVDFQKVCKQCEEIVLENLFSNGGTLQFRYLTYQADCIIIAQEENIIGFNALLVDFRDGFYVNQIAVKKNCQQKGIGTHLIVMSKDMADKLSLPVYAHVREYNIGSQKTFEKCGFKRDDTYRTEDSYFYAYTEKKIGEKRKSRREP